VTPLIPERLESERLAYERIAPARSELEPLLLDPRVSATLHPGAPPTGADVLDHARAKHEHWECHGFGYWLLRDRATGEVVGRGGLQCTEVDSIAAVEVGWAMTSARWGQGLATELAKTSVRVGLDDLRADELVAFSLPDNVASRRVRDKAGFVYDRDVIHANLPHVLYVVRSRRG
jgi:[ribosomal protein S5]-alanine N-acetyltransferase